MSYLTEDKVVILGAGGAIGSNMMQAVLTMEISPNVCGYDPFAKGVQRSRRRNVPLCISRSPADLDR